MEIPTLAYSDSGFGVAVAVASFVGSGVAFETAEPLTALVPLLVLPGISSNATIASGFDCVAPT